MLLEFDDRLDELLLERLLLELDELLAEPAVHANTRAYFDPAEAGPRLLP